jgi:hypothetical protein
MFETYKIQFSNRESFNKAQPIICDPNTRLNFTGDLDIGYADMIVSFSNEYHYKNAINRLKDAKIVDFQ